MISNAFIPMQPGSNLQELKLSSEIQQQLQQVIAADHMRQPGKTVPDEMRKTTAGKAVLFCGASGTGKSQAAAALGKEMGSPVYRVQQSAVFSKYIGETEKNLDRLFKKAADSEAVLFFDEADALFGKRTEVKDAHDRYANAEANYLLQQVEKHNVFVILATKTKASIDDAFLRRLRFVVQF